MAVDDGTGVPDPRASRVVLVGVPVYGAFEHLPAVTAGVEALRAAFTDRRIWGIGRSRCTVTPEGAGTGQILTAIRAAAALATDTLFIYFSGHGLVDLHDGELYLALRDSLPNEPESALRYEYLRRAVLGSRARNKVVVIDSCYSGLALLGGMGGGEEIADRTSIDGTFLLTSSAETRISLSPDGEPFTAFTGELVRALTEGVPGAGRLLTMGALYRHLHASLSGRSRPVPQQRSRNAGADLVIARNLAAGADVSVPEVPEAPGPREPQAKVPQRLGRFGIALTAYGHRRGESVALLREAAEAGDAVAMNHLGLHLADSGDLGGAEAMYRRAVAGGVREALFNLGHVLELLGRGGEAETFYRLAIAAGVAGAMNNLGLLLKERGEIGEAEAWYRCAIQLGVTDPVVRRNLDTLLRQRGDSTRIAAAGVDEDPRPRLR
ncbi:caspase, EACC1-associated type [Phytomonospora endophytica]|uniref:Peptidase C14 caspase domain-containing protein n=1 Tax=Phytomonospora endophytica TaxID=714109 RepID=A0A841FFJ4_9ACTN|nr:tetratricopeptide repeat protein [Phytomonospora endophytica]MBB6036091.1 hypothetical protein [Phytomonospora endophytica]GIG66994.1 hypothetical protein Pen01_32890 [Phytomonospora endophytica]